MSLRQSEAQLVQDGLCEVLPLSQVLDLTKRGVRQLHALSRDRFLLSEAEPPNQWRQGQAGDHERRGDRDVSDEDHQRTVGEDMSFRGQRHRERRGERHAAPHPAPPENGALGHSRFGLAPSRNRHPHQLRHGEHPSHPHRDERGRYRRRVQQRRTIWVVDRSTVVPACSLGEAELQDQLGRYASAGHGAELVESGQRRRVVRVSGDVPESLILRLIEVERGCCPFFALAWDGATRRLAIEVPHSDHEPALEAIVTALGAAPS